jgi:hypothetical protein
MIWASVNLVFFIRILDWLKLKTLILTCTKIPATYPTSFNGLGIGDNDHGSLNSEFYARYFFKDLWAVKIGFQYLFTEYTTNTNVQQFPELNDRFRNKSSMISIGVTRQFK